ncbi:DUF6221 family protein [Streptomyces sp. NPDC008150]|uniref:DUF6221 family protein n=1 Tax=Streptomyces sp. NPDC008150 TaxID=3364816 RepID=UPI0036EE4B85
MSAQGEDVLAWLESAIAAREQAARDAARSYGPRWVRPVDTDVVRVSEDGVVWFQALSDEIAEHVVYNSPESALRRCAADRVLLELHGGRAHGCPARDYDGDLDDFARFYNHEVCLVVQSIAESYGWTGGDR